jgi:superkiller protein 3
LFTDSQSAVPSTANPAKEHARRGEEFRVQDKPQEAAASYEEALRLDPDHLDARVNLGIVRAGQGKFDEAIGHWVRALQLRPDCALAHNNLGVALTEQGKLEEARASLERALRLQPDNA